MNRDSKNCILFFVKYPLAGRVKTRLAEQLGQTLAARLYESFVADILISLEKLDVNFRILFDPPHDQTQFVRWLGDKYTYLPQTGNDLGGKMKNAFEQAFNQGCKKVVIIGSDSPDMPTGFIENAFKGLCENDVVIGPSTDGGYYLIAFSKDRFVPQVFEGIEWSTSSVFDETVKILENCGKTTYILPKWYDVDTKKDLDELIDRNRHSEFRNSKTFTFAEDFVIKERKTI